MTKSRRSIKTKLVVREVEAPVIEVNPILTEYQELDRKLDMALEKIARKRTRKSLE